MLNENEVEFMMLKAIRDKLIAPEYRKMDIVTSIVAMHRQSISEIDSAIEMLINRKLENLSPHDVKEENNKLSGNANNKIEQPKKRGPKPKKKSKWGKSKKSQIKMNGKFLLEKSLKKRGRKRKVKEAATQSIPPVESLPGTVQ